MVRAFAGCDPPPDEIPHVARQFGIGIGDRLPLANEAAHFLHQRLGPRLLARVWKLTISPIGRRQIAVRGQRLGQHQCEEQREKPHRASSSFFRIFGTSDASMGPMC